MEMEMSAPNLVILVGIVAIIATILVTPTEFDVEEDVRNFYDQDDPNSDMYIIH